MPDDLWLGDGVCGITVCSDRKKMESETRLGAKLVSTYLFETLSV